MGSYFGFQTHESYSGDENPWLGIESLLDGSDRLEQRYRQVRSALATMAGVPGGAIEFRVAASVGQLGLTARLFCPAFGAALLDCRLDLGQARWKPVVGGVMPLFLPESAVHPGTGTSMAATLDRQIRPLVERTAAMSVSAEVLWGNVASVIAGAVTTLVTARPDLAARANDLGAEALSQPDLANTFTGMPGREFRRWNCCLIYRIALATDSPGDRAYCGDCILG